MTIPAGLTLIPRVTDMRNGTFRPEVVIEYPGGGDIVFLIPVASVAAARLRADAAVQAAAEAPAALTGCGWERREPAAAKRAGFSLAACYYHAV